MSDSSERKIGKVSQEVPKSHKHGSSIGTEYEEQESVHSSGGDEPLGSSLGLREIEQQSQNASASGRQEMEHISSWGEHETKQPSHHASGCGKQASEPLSSSSGQHDEEQLSKHAVG